MVVHKTINNKLLQIFNCYILSLLLDQVHQAYHPHSLPPIPLRWAALLASAPNSVSDQMQELRFYVLHNMFDVSSIDMMK